MKRIDSRRHKLNSLLMENFGYVPEEGSCPSEELEEEVIEEEVIEEEELEEISRIREVVRRALRKRNK